ncbi:D-arabinono-1,4-lactone oxidase [Lapillicoccus sp.]|uniref:D-arabinono-1,4-lactone oxidase n=1 Tax=Lapillicoccus sp. TaxID=1909287 RepID=UPI0032646B41
MEHNWSGNHRYAGRLIRPATLGELAELVGAAPRVRALGSRHSFTDIGDAGSMGGSAGAAGSTGEPGVLVSLDGLPPVFSIAQTGAATGAETEEQGSTVTVGAGMRYGEVSRRLHKQGWALANLASLPHISVAGAVATGTHGSGDTNASLATAVAAITLLDASGRERRLARGDADFDGSVVGLGALGIVTTLTLDIEPTYEVRQDVWTDLPGRAVEDHLDEITGSGYSVSLFTDFSDRTFAQAWVKTREESAPAVFFGARRATRQLHPDIGAVADGVTQQGGIPGPWLDRLPHFRMEFTPSHGAELQSEYLVPRPRVLDALEAMRRLRPVFAGLLRVSELRTVAADGLWLSPAYETDVVGFHLTWELDEPAVYAVLPAIETALLPLGARPHWGKCFVATSAELEALYPRMADFRALRGRVDPDGTFGNAFLDRVVGGSDSVAGSVTGR